MKALKSQLNCTTDMVVRYGGEKFAAILSDSGAEGGRVIAEKLRVAVSDLNIPHSQSKVTDHITVSVGVAAFQFGTTLDANSLLKAAGTALYDAKHSGRNCVRQSLPRKRLRHRPTDR